MSDQSDERLSRAAMKSLRASAPADLKAALKRRAPKAAAGPSLWDGLRELLSGGAWAYGAGAAFAAAAVAIAVVRAVPPRPAPAPETVAAAPVSPAALADLWSDDDGEDHD